MKEEANIREVEEALLSQERSPSVAVELVKSGETGTKSQDKVLGFQSRVPLLTMIQDVCEHVENGMAVEESFSDSSKTFSAGSSDKDLAEKALPPMPQSLRVVRTKEGDMGVSDGSNSNEEELQEEFFVRGRENVRGGVRRTGGRKMTRDVVVLAHSLLCPPGIEELQPHLSQVEEQEQSAT